MSTLQIVPVASEADMTAFISLPWEIYRDDPYWVPPLVSERRSFFDRGKHPFHEHAKVDYFLAKRGDRVIGRIAALVNHAHNDFHQERAAFFGAFEVLDDAEAAVALLRRACEWARSEGMSFIRGPATFSSNEEWGLLVDGFESPPTVLTVYNPPRYAAYIESAGFTKAMDLLGYEIRREQVEREPLPAKFTRAVGRARRHSGIRLRSLEMRRYWEEVDQVKVIYNRAWARNWGFVPLSDAEFERIARDLKPIIDPDLTFAAELDGRTVGFSLPLPDINEAMRLAYPNPTTPEWIALARLLWHWRLRPKIRTLRMFALGVLPEAQLREIVALLYYQTAQIAMRKGYARTEISWALETNAMINPIIKAAGGRPHKRWRIYEQELD